MPKIHLSELGTWAKRADRLMVPIMRFLSGALHEEPQQTHRWNNRRLRQTEIELLDASLMVFQAGNPSAFKWRWKMGLPIFHLPLLGGWKEYVVLRPSGLPAGYKESWHLGWHLVGLTGISRIKLMGPARALIGRGDVRFFAFDKDGQQIPLVAIGTGRIGDRSLYSQLPLL